MCDEVTLFPFHFCLVITAPLQSIVALTTINRHHTYRLLWILMHCFAFVSFLDLTSHFNVGLPACIFFFSHHLPSNKRINFLHNSLFFSCLPSTCISSFSIASLSSPTLTPSSACFLKFCDFIDYNYCNTFHVTPSTSTIFAPLNECNEMKCTVLSHYQILNISVKLTLVFV